MPRVLIAGAGLAGLACAVQLAKAGIEVVLLEAAPHAGGRCRSFHEKTLDTTIDNGNHLLLSGNTAAMSLLDDIGARDRLVGPGRAEFRFADLASGERWTVSPSRGPIPLWVFNPKRRVAGTSPADYFQIIRLLKRHHGRTFSEVLPSQDTLFQRFWDPFIVAVLNAHPDQAAAELVTPVLWETFAKGADACEPLVARAGLSDTFVEPALKFIKSRGGEVRFGARVAEITTRDNRAVSLRCGRNVLALGDDDVVVVAVPAPVAEGLIPGLSVPQEHSAIVNLHYKLDAQPRLDTHLVGLVNGLAQWLFVRGNIASVTISAANEVAKRDSEDIAKEVWGNIAAILKAPLDPIPPHRVIKEKLATFHQTPAQVAMRPRTENQTTNLLLAGDWTDTGLPATIEGAIRSGNAAAGAACRRMRTG